ncbi:STAS domain-containing protein [Streptacidiphilus melanogenes]|uniref:STAS domain-containing protein n=1 Tax=Streptacidiphilus melanogenes TaxID=411235 RepID=UPI000693DBEA|nr:STAS domain-containing protein [Streptacidiphilus melanogenes]
MSPSQPPETWQPETGGDRFTVTHDPGAGECVLRLRGELDHDTAPALRAELRRCEGAGSTRVLVDCSSLGFCDSTGLSVLLDARARANVRGAAIVLVGLAPVVARIFEITGADSLFPRYRTVAQARAAG